MSEKKPDPAVFSESNLLAAITPDLGGSTVADTQSVPQLPDDEGQLASASQRMPSGMHESGKLGRFNILDILGSGGMGVVLSAYDPQLDRKVAIKVLRTRGLTGARREREAARLLREARAMAQLNHPHIVTVYEAGTIDDRVFIAMEYVPGQTVRLWLAETKRSVADILDVYVKAGRGLAAGHHAGLVHRDFKPDNILIGFDGRVRVIDFGLARPMRNASTTDPASSISWDEGEPSETSGTHLALTTVGSLFGTPVYMSPEQHDKQQLDARSDQYAFCVSLFEALYSRLPFPAQSYAELAAAVTGGKLSIPDDPAIPAHVVAAVRRGLSVDPEARFPSMDGLLDALQPAARRRRGRLIGAAAFGAAAAVIATLAVVKMTDHDQPAAVDPCAGGEERFAGVWDPAVEAKLKQAFLATKRAHAPDTTTRVIDELDHYKTEWIASKRTICVATTQAEQSAQAFDLRMRCMRERIDELGALTALLARADAPTVDNALPAAQGLRRPIECQKLSPNQTQPPSTTQAAQLPEVERVIADVDAHMDLADFTYAEREALRILPRAEQIGYDPTLTNVMVDLGVAQAGTAKHADAERTLRKALVVAARIKDDRMLAQLWVLLIWTIAQQGRYDEALALRDVADIAISRSEANAKLRSNLEYNVAATYYLQGKYQSAIEHYDAAIAQNDKNLGNAYNALGGAYLHAGNLFEAKKAFEKALLVAEKTRGPLHPEVALPLSNLGALAQATGDFERATNLHLRALKVLEEVDGPEHEQVGMIVYSLGVSANGREDYKAAIPLYARSLAIFEKISPDNSHVGLALVGLADCREEVGDYAQAVADGERGYQLVAARKGDPVQLALAQYVLAKALWSANRDRARALVLARDARKGFAAGGIAALNGLAAVDKWFKKIGVGVPTP